MNSAKRTFRCYSALVRVVVNAQDRDGGWGDLATTALCVRWHCFIRRSRGQGDAIEAGLAYLGIMQKDEGVWTSGPMRRMPADPAVSLFILYQLGDNPSFPCQAVRFSDATAWFTHSMNPTHEPGLPESIPMGKPTLALRSNRPRG